MQYTANLGSPVSYHYVSKPLFEKPSVLSLNSFSESSAYVRQSVFLEPGAWFCLPGTLGLLHDLDLYLYWFWEVQYCPVHCLSLKLIDCCSCFCWFLISSYFSHTCTRWFQLLGISKGLCREATSGKIFSAVWVWGLPGLGRSSFSVETQDMYWLGLVWHRTLWPTQMTLPSLKECLYFKSFHSHGLISYLQRIALHER